MTSALKSSTAAHPFAGRRPAWLLGAAPALFLASKRDVTKAGNETSRLAVVESLVDHGTFAIDRSRFSTPDKVQIQRHFYSDKPPLLSIGLAGIHWLLCHIGGLGFERCYGTTLQLLTFLGIGGFSLLLAVLCFGRLEQAGASPAISWLAGAVVVLGTWVLSFGTTINNHTPAAAVLFLLEWTLEGALGASWEPQRRTSRFFAAGVQHRSRTLELVFAMALCVGLVTSGVGAYNPWPVVYEGASTAEGAVEDDIRNPFFANLLCMSFELAPTSAITAALIDHIYGPKRSRKYLLLAYDSARRPDLVERVRRLLPK